jgi:hypothetical protein
MRISVLPGSNLGFQAGFDITSLKRKSTNLFNSWNFSNFILEFLELVEFLLKVFKLWICGVKFLELFDLNLLP